MYVLLFVIVYFGEQINRQEQGGHKPGISKIIRKFNTTDKYQETSKMNRGVYF